MNRRLQLHDILLTFVKNVYFQPPSKSKINFPCIIYNKSVIESKYANDANYGNYTRYLVTYIDPNPDSDVPEKILSLPMCKHDRSFTADNLNHDVFNIYF